MAALGENLRRLRRERGLTQMGLASASGVSRATIATIERGARSNAESCTLKKLAGALGTSIDSICDGSPQ
jgi:transcriptional regulator with XRE-family HTH domain